MDAYRPHIAMVAEVLARLGTANPARQDLTALIRASLEVRADDSVVMSIPALLHAAGAQAGVDLWRVPLTPAAAIRAVIRVGPMAALMPDGNAVIILEPARFGRVRLLECTLEGVVSRGIASARSIATILGLESIDVTTDWLSRRPGLPLERLETPPNATRPLSSLTRLWSLSLLELRDLRSAFVYAIGISLLSLAVPLTVQLLISQALAGVLWQPAIILTVILVVTLGFRSFLEACESLLIESVSRRIFVRVARDFAARIVRLGTRRPHDLPIRLAAHRIFDGATIEKGIAAIAYDGFAGILTIFATVTLLTIYHPIFALAAFIVIAMATIILWAPARRATQQARLESKAKHAIAVEIDRLGHRPDLFAGQPAGDFALGEIEFLLGKWSSARQNHFRVYFKQFIGLIIVQVIASTALLAIGAWLIFTGELTVGQLVAGELMMTAALVGVGRFGKLLPKMYDVLAALDKVGQVLDLPRRSEAGLELPAAPVDITLGFGSKAGPVHIAAGARACMRGEPDALERLFRGLNDGDHDIRIDGRGASGYRQSTLGERVIWVDEPFNLPGSLLVNLRMVDPSMTEEEAWDLLTAVGFDFGRHKQGIATVIGPDGEGLSRAERVRLSIARAIASRPAILIIDGILDRLSCEEREGLARMLAGPVDTCPWTLLITSADPEVLRIVDCCVTASGGAFAVTPILAEATR